MLLIVLQFQETMGLVTNFGFYLCIVISVEASLHLQGSLITSLIKAHRISPLGVIIGCDSESWFNIDELHNICKIQHEDVLQPLSILNEGITHGTSKCVHGNFTRTNPDQGAKYSPGNQGQNLVYFGDVRHGLRVPTVYGKLFNLNYTNSLLLIRSVSSSLPQFEGDGYGGKLFNRVPSLTFVLNKRGLHRMCLFCIQAKFNLIHSFSLISSKQISFLGKSPLENLPTHFWVAFFNFEFMDENIYTKEFFEEHPIQFGHNNSEVSLAADIVKYLNLTKLLNCPKSQVICQELQPEYSVESNAGAIEAKYRGTLILTPPSVELTFLVLIPDSSNVFYSLLRVPFKWKFVLATVGSIFAICLATFCFQMKEVTLFTSLVLTISFMIRSTVSQSISQFSSNSNSLKLICLTWLFCCIVLTELYRGQSIGNFIKPQQAKPINSFKELVDTKTTSYKLVAQLNQIQQPDFNSMRKEVMGNWDFELCRLINLCPVCGMIRLEFEATRKAEYRQFLASMNDCERFTSSYTNVIRRLEKPNQAVVFVKKYLNLIKLFMQRRRPNRKYHITTNGIQFPKYTSVRQDLFSERVVRLIRILDAAGVSDIHAKVDVRLDSLQMSKVINKLVNLTINKPADQNSTVDRSLMTLKNFRNLFIAGGGMTMFIFFVFMCEVHRCFIRLQLNQLKIYLSSVWVFVNQTFEFIYRMSMHRIIKLLFRLKQIQYRKCFEQFIQRVTVTKDSFVRRQIRVKNQNKRSELSSAKWNSCYNFSFKGLYQKQMLKPKKTQNRSIEVAQSVK